MEMIQSMGAITLNSILLFFISFVILSISAYIGKRAFKKIKVDTTPAVGEENFKIVLGAVLSLLGLLIGFCMSMAIDGFNTRQMAEQDEAIAIRSVYLRAEILDHHKELTIKGLLNEHLIERIKFYEADDDDARLQLRNDALTREQKIWHLVRDTPPAIAPLILNSVDELIAAHQRTLAGWHNQIPMAAWILLMLIAIASNLLIGYCSRKMNKKSSLLFILPAMIALSFIMISEIDDPGIGAIRVTPTDLELLVEIIKFY